MLNSLAFLTLKHYRDKTCKKKKEEKMTTHIMNYKQSMSCSH